MSQPPSPSNIATTLAAFVDTLLPGDDLFPAASAAGTHGLLADRVRKMLGNEALTDLVTALTHDGKSLPRQAAEERLASVRRLEQDLPDRFAFLRAATYYAYYQSPSVTAAIRALGHDYHDAPQPLGYALAPFDPTPGVDAPAVPRGWYKRTEDVTRIDVSGLPVLQRHLIEEA